MNIMKKIIKAVALALAAVLLLALVVLGWYLPHFWNGKEPAALSPDADGITMMSCNVRCLTPLDLGKKSWFYRADLLMDDIASQMPGIIGFQEATRWQYNYLVDVLPEYDSVITYRDQSVASEGCPIFYHDSTLYEDDGILLF